MVIMRVNSVPRSTVEASRAELATAPEAADHAQCLTELAAAGGDNDKNGDSDNGNPANVAVRGVTVETLTPDNAEQAGVSFEAARGEKPPARASQTPEEVVDTALRALARGKSHVISGWINRVMTESERLAPRSLVTRMAGRMMRGRYDE